MSQASVRKPDTLYSSILAIAKKRKSSWGASDISRFTEIYREEIDLEKEELGIKNEHKNAIEYFDRCHRSYLRFLCPGVPQSGE